MQPSRNMQTIYRPSPIGSLALVISACAMGYYGITETGSGSASFYEKAVLVFVLGYGGYRLTRMLIDSMPGIEKVKAEMDFYAFLVFLFFLANNAGLLAIGLCASFIGLVFLLQLFLQVPRLVLNGEGITVKKLLGENRAGWGSISEFSPLARDMLMAKITGRDASEALLLSGRLVVPAGENSGLLMAELNRIRACALEGKPWPNPKKSHIGLRILAYLGINKALKPT